MHALRVERPAVNGQGRWVVSSFLGMTSIGVGVVLLILATLVADATLKVRRASAIRTVTRVIVITKRTAWSRVQGRYFP